MPKEGGEKGVRLSVSRSANALLLSGWAIAFGFSSHHWQYMDQSYSSLGKSQDYFSVMLDVQS